MKKLIWSTVIILFCCIGVYLKFYNNQENMPTGCDEFGYLNLAKAFDNKTVYKDHTQRPYLNELLDTLRDSDIEENEIEWMIVPHAYYVIPNTEKIINQYPPGTSFLLSYISLPNRKQMFSFLAIFLVLTLPIIVLGKSNGLKAGWFYVALLLFVLIMTVSSPFLTELTRINSLALTFGMLIAAGMVLEIKPLLSCLLIALSVNFRVINILMLIPLISFISWPLPLKKEEMPKLLGIGLKHLTITLLAMLPYFLYVYFLLGNPLIPTYSSIDTATTINIFDNILYYINLSQGWFIFHVILIFALFTFFYYKKINKIMFLKLLIFPIINYLFFIFHKVQINYYPYASSFILLGFIFYKLKCIYVDEKYYKFIAILCFIFPVFILLDGGFQYFSKTHKNFHEKKNEYLALCSYDIVWGDILSGTSEYVCDNNGFKYGATSSRARILALKFLQRRKYTQAILLNDNLVAKSDIINELGLYDIKFHLITDKLIGEILVID
jgi:hypothetical protein